MLYSLLRPLLFRLDAETAHGLALTALRLSRRRPAPAAGPLTTSVAGISFPNPLGLAAGFDKDGAVPDAILSRLTHKRDLGVHTEMFSDRVVDLVNAGVITNRHKTVGMGRIVTSFINGTKRLFDFVNDNPLVAFYPCDWTNDTAIIRQNPKAVAINSAVQIDLTGQVCADSIGHRIYSGIGGQMDFIRGAALSPGGKPIIALPSVACSGKVSRIVSQLSPGAGVVTTRGHVHWVATEYGVVNLHGMTLRQRGEALISIAHPDFRSELRKELAAIRHFPMAPKPASS